MSLRGENLRWSGDIHGKHDRHPAPEAQAERYESYHLVVHGVVRLHSDRRAGRPAREEPVRRKAGSVLRSRNTDRAQPEIEPAYADRSGPEESFRGNPRKFSADAGCL